MFKISRLIRSVKMRIISAETEMSTGKQCETVTNFSQVGDRKKGQLRQTGLQANAPI